MKILMYIVCATLLIAACAKDDQSAAEPQTAHAAVTFGVSEVQPISRTGFEGELDEWFMRATGFGVYAYVSHEGNLWLDDKGNDDPADDEFNGASWTPDFMLNEHVTYESSEGWVYRPLKYWPNQAATGSDPVDVLGGGSATTTGNIDRVSFFAYAPYVDQSLVAYDDPAEAMTAAADPAFTGEGILSLPSATTTGTPKIAYSVARRPAFSPDLMYGVAARRYTSDESAGREGADVEAGMPLTDMTKVLAGDRLDYRFCHALTRLVIYADAIDNMEVPEDFNNLRIVINNITISDTPAGGQLLYKRGVLSLQNTEAGTPLWEDIAGPVGSMGDYLSTTMKRSDEGVFTNTYFAHQPLGVTTTEQSVFGLGVDGRTAAALFFIAGPVPDPYTPPTITVDYSVIRRTALEPFGYTETRVANTLELEGVTFAPSETTVLRLHFDLNEKDPILVVDSSKYTEQW